MGFSKLLGEHGRRQLTDQDIMDYARLIHDAAAHLLSVINDILDISKIQSGKYALDAREVSLDEVLKACVASYRAVAETAGLNLEYRQEDGLPAVRGDAQRLKQAFNNLIGNAVRFTRPGGAIVVQARPLADGGAEVRVRDTGVGMDEEEIRVALTPFGQVDGSRSRWREGAGLGLPIANALIELHAGELGIESRKLQGTEVVVTLPPPQVLSFIQDRNPTRGRPAASQG